MHFRPKTKLTKTSQSPHFSRRKRKQNLVGLYFYWLTDHTVFCRVVLKCCWKIQTYIFIP